MPTVLRRGQFRFYFFSDEGNEPGHIHIENPVGDCKFWLTPVMLAKNKGIKGHDLNEIERIIYDNLDLLKKEYYEYHGRE